VLRDNGNETYLVNVGDTSLSCHRVARERVLIPEFRGDPCMAFSDYGIEFEFDAPSNASVLAVWSGNGW
jgi:hypothetical protein